MTQMKFIHAEKYFVQQKRKREFSTEQKKNVILFTIFQIPFLHAGQFRFEAKLSKVDTPVTSIVVRPRSSLHVIQVLCKLRNRFFKKRDHVIEGKLRSPVSAMVSLYFFCHHVDFFV